MTTLTAAAAKPVKSGSVSRAACTAASLALKGISAVLGVPAAPTSLKPPAQAVAHWHCSTAVAVKATDTEPRVLYVDGQSNHITAVAASVETVRCAAVTVPVNQVPRAHMQLSTQATMCTTVQSFCEACITFHSLCEAYASSSSSR
jgi:hypothetical protein